MNERSTKEKILNVAAELFYSNGYVNTGVEEIISACNSKKPTLYYYFKSKADLGLAYLDFKELEFLEIMDKLEERSETLQDFFGSWIMLVKRLAKKKEFFGCPFSSFASQLNQTSKPFFETKLHQIKKHWLAKVKNILENKSSSNKKNTSIDFDSIAMEVMVIYVGGSNLYRMTGQIEFINVMGKQFEEIAIRLSF